MHMTRLRMQVARLLMWSMNQIASIIWSRKDERRKASTGSTSIRLRHPIFLPHILLRELICSPFSTFFTPYSPRIFLFIFRQPRRKC